jgi:hypothetical protein
MGVRVPSVTKRKGQANYVVTPNYKLYKPYESFSAAAPCERTLKLPAIGVQRIERGGVISCLREVLPSSCLNYRTDFSVGFFGCYLPL